MSPEPVWYLDLGASHHVTSNPANLATSENYPSNDQLLVGSS